MRVSMDHVTRVAAVAIFTIVGVFSSTTLVEAQAAKNVVCDGCVGTLDIKDGAVRARDMAADAVRGITVRNNSLDRRDLRDEPGIEFDNRDLLGTEISVGKEWTIMTTLDVSQPRPGLVHCSASGHVDYDKDNFTPSIHLGWSTSGGISAPEGYNRLSLPPGADQSTYMPITAARTFGVAAKGLTTFYLKAQSPGATTGSEVDFVLHQAVCMYFPTRY